jgi:hypothetical protein
LIDLNFRIIDAFVTEPPVFTFDDPQKFLCYIAGRFADVKFLQQALEIANCRWRFLGDTDIARSADKQGAVNVEQYTLNRFRQPASGTH